jgi:monoamine oxidase
MSADVDVLIIGAGVAGISAAHALGYLGRSCVLLEALQRPGGRAFTDTSNLSHINR